MTTVAQRLPRVQPDAALHTLAAQARTRSAGEAARIDRGLVIALNGGVTLQADGTALVQSQKDAEIVYQVNGHCDCPDAPRAPEGRCKHRWAKCLVSRAAALGTVDEVFGDHATVAAAQFAAIRPGATPTCPRCYVPFGEDEPALPGEVCVVCAYHDDAPPPVAPVCLPVVAEALCPEAAFSLCLKGRIQGQDAQLTVRAQTAAAFLVNVAAVRGLFDAPTAPPAPPTPPSLPAAAAPEAEVQAVCPIHGVEMRRQSNERGWWFSHPVDGGAWCKGKASRGR